jgi:N-methylhydantoinase B
LGLRQENFEQLPADVYAVVWTAAGGFGDPMERAPEHVFEDWRNGAVTLGAAREIYGVVIARGELDAGATKALREKTRRSRVERANAKPRRLAGPVALRVTDNLVVRMEGDGPHHACAKCDGDLGSTRANYKDHCVREDNPVSHATPLAGDPSRYIDATPEFRQFFCPSCGTLIENEIALSTEPVLHDIEVDVDERLVHRPSEAAE